MLKMGGSEILKSLGGKSTNVKADRVQYVYQWVDPTKSLFLKPKEFLLASSKEIF